MGVTFLRLWKSFNKIAQAPGKLFEIFFFRFQTLIYLLQSLWKQKTGDVFFQLKDRTKPLRQNFFNDAYSSLPINFWANIIKDELLISLSFRRLLGRRLVWRRFYKATFECHPPQILSDLWIVKTLRHFYQIDKPWPVSETTRFILNSLPPVSFKSSLRRNLLVPSGTKHASWVLVLMLSWHENALASKTQRLRPLPKRGVRF